MVEQTTELVIVFIVIIVAGLDIIPLNATLNREIGITEWPIQDISIKVMALVKTKIKIRVKIRVIDGIMDMCGEMAKTNGEHNKVTENL